jgi:hypothetical protein
MTRRFYLREEVTDCNVGDVLELGEGVELMCTEKKEDTYRIGASCYHKSQLPKYFYTYKEVYPECSENGLYYKELSN